MKKSKASNTKPFRISSLREDRYRRAQRAHLLAKVAWLQLMGAAKLLEADPPWRPEENNVTPGSKELSGYARAGAGLARNLMEHLESYAVELPLAGPVLDDGGAALLKAVQALDLPTLEDLDAVDDDRQSGRRPMHLVGRHLTIGHYRALHAAMRGPTP